jgi:hypothetical protein
MTPTATRPRPQAGPGQLRRRVRFALAACACAALVACGGGGGMAGVGTGGTGSFAVGSINGFGSIQVNGLRFDTAGAGITNLNAQPGAPALTAADLQLGMTVEVLGSLNPNTNRGSADSVVIAAEMKGAITSVDVAKRTLVVFGRTVHVTLATVFAGKLNATTPVTGLAQLEVDHVVEVYGLPQPDGSLRATRIEFEAATVTAFTAEYGESARFHVEGLLTAPTGVNGRFSVAGVEFNVTPAVSATLAGLSDGTEVTVFFTPTTGTGPFDPVALRVESRVFPAGKGLAEIEGLVSGLVTSAEGVSTFRLNGLPVRVNATGVTFEFDGLGQPTLANGIRVEVYGNIIDGVLVATKVEFEDDDDEESDLFEFAGRVVCLPTPPCRATAGNFRLDGIGITIDYVAGTNFLDGLTPATLDGRRIEVYAKVLPSAGAGAGNRFVATKIELDD